MLEADTTVPGTPPKKQPYRDAAPELLKKLAPCKLTKVPPDADPDVRLSELTTGHAAGCENGPTDEGHEVELIAWISSQEADPAHHPQKEGSTTPHSEHA